MNASRATAVLVVLLLPTPSWGHASIPGIGNAYAAFAHSITEPPAALALLGLGLLVGMHGAETLKWIWPGFFAAMVAGVAATLFLKAFIDPELPLVIVALATGLAAAAGVPLPHAAAAGLGLLAGYFFGVLIAPSPASWMTQTYAVAGGLLGANFALVFVVAAVDMIRTQRQMAWVSIGLRVVASWVAAISTLMIALSTR